MIVVFHKNFEKQFKKLPRKIRDKVASRIELFVKNPTDPRLRDHGLIAKYQGYRSINITGDYRAIYKLHNKQAIFTHIGTHSQLYKK